jgi:hypothetical protein
MRWEQTELLAKAGKACRTFTTPFESPSATPTRITTFHALARPFAPGTVGAWSKPVSTPAFRTPLMTRSGMPSGRQVGCDGP